MSRRLLVAPAVLASALLFADSGRAVAEDSASESAAIAAAKPPQRTTGFATAADGTRIYFERVGTGPAIVFIHGLGGNHAVWFQQVPHFAASNTVVTMSQRGFAPSGGAQDNYDVRVLVGDLVAVLEAAGIERAVIVGQSMGGWTALAMTLAKPERVVALVLADTVAGISDDVIAAHHHKMIEQARAVSASPPPLSMHPALDPSFSRSNPAMGYLYQALSTFGSPKPGVIAAQLAASRVDPALLSKNAVPTLFIVGKVDTVFPPAIIAAAAAHLPASRVAEIDGGHSPYFERPQSWNEAVGEFLSSLPDAQP